MKVHELVDKNDLRLKHITGEYLKYKTHSPDDVVYAILSKNKKSMKMKDLIKIFGDEKAEHIEELIADMVFMGYLSVTDDEEKTISLL